MHPYEENLLPGHTHLFGHFVLDPLRVPDEFRPEHESLSDLIAEIVLDVALELLAGAALLGIGLGQEVYSI